MTEAKADNKYIGLWAKPDKNGNTFLSGSDNDILFLIFSDKDDPTKKSLHTRDTSVEGSKLKMVGVFETITSDKGEYRKLNNMCIFPNDRRTADKHPHFNLVVYDNAANS